MLHRPASVPVWSPVRRLTARLGAWTGASSGLLQFVLIAAFLCAIGCVYVWQVNELSNIHDATVELQQQAKRLEEKNVVLSIQLAQWNSPSYVDKRSVEEGYVAAPQHMIESAAVAVAPAGPTTTR